MNLYRNLDISSSTDAIARVHRKSALRSSRVMALLTSATLTGALFFGIGASGASSNTPAGGSVNLYITPNTSSAGGGGGTVVMTGAIGDYGTTTGQSDKNGEADKGGGYGNIELQKGTIRVDLAALDAKSKNLGSESTIDPVGCSQAISVTAPVTFVSGTGLYKGISGTINLTETAAFILPRYTSGKDKGKCNESNSAAPLAVWGSLSGSGTVSF